jgi:DNA-binding MarR family transcriptional regulator
MFMDMLDHTPDPMSDRPSPRFTAKQGQYLAFIHTYTLLHREAPAEADFQRFFQVTPPAVHDMIVALERRGLISRVPRQPRTIKLLVSVEELPTLQDQNHCGGAIGSLASTAIARCG